MRRRTFIAALGSAAAWPVVARAAAGDVRGQLRLGADQRWQLRRVMRMG